MKTIYLIRHAKSDWSEAGQADHDRDLNDRGLRDAPQMAKVMKLNNAKPDLILTSSAVRALKTARFFQEVFNVSEDNFQINRGLYHAAPEKMLEELSLIPDEFTTVYLVAHNPGITELANEFEGQFIDNIPTTGIVKIELTIAIWQEISTIKGTVTDFIYPKMYV